MAFNSYEELRAAVEQRRQDILTLEVEIDTPYSREHEEAKEALQQAKGMKMLLQQDFLGDGLEELEARVAATKPEAQSVWIQFAKLPLNEWSALISKPGKTPIEQYESVLPTAFKGVYGVDPVKPDDFPEDQVWEAPEPLTTDPRVLSSTSGDSILPGAALHSVVQAFMSWQNSGGAVSIRPTKSGRV